MHKKRALVLWVYLSLLALAACGPKVVDDADIVSVDYSYKFADWRVVEEWSTVVNIWKSDSSRLESVILWAKLDDEFIWKVDWRELYWAEYRENLTQSYPNIIITEVLWISDAVVGSEVFVESFGTGQITSINADDEWYNVYVVDFNDSKTYSELSYSVKVTNIEKN